MYLIKTGNSIIYNSAEKDPYPISKPSLHLELNDAGSAEFGVLPSHPLYGVLKKMKTFLTIYRDDTELFYGRIINSDRDNMEGVLSVNCEGAMTFFLDTEMTAGTYTETIAEFISRCVSSHNSQVETEKQFTVGEITADKAVEIDPKTGETVKIVFEVKDYPQTKSVLESMITAKYGGFFRIRPNPNGPHFLDYVQSYGRENTQPIKIGDNIVSKSDHISGENIFTILRPLGKDNLTIDDLDQGDVTLPNVLKDGSKLRLTNMIAEYGSIIRTEKFSEIDDKEMLLRAAEEFITRQGTQLPSTSKINFVDWYHLNPDVMDVQLGDTFSNIEGFSGEVLTVGSLDLDLENPGNDEMELRNPAEIAAHDPASSSGSLSSSYASRCQHIDYIYKYIHEGDNLLQLHTDQIEITAEKMLQLSSALTTITGGQVYIVADEIDDPKNPGKKTAGDVRLVARRVEEDGSVVTTELNVNMNNVAITNGNLEVEGYVKANELQAAIAHINNLFAGYESAEAINVMQITINRGSVVDLNVDSLRVAGRQYTERAVYDMNDNIVYCLARS